MKRTRAGRSPLLRLARHSLSLIGSAVAIRVSSFAVYVMVARYRGAFEFGQLSLATTVFAILLELALLGMRRVVVRDVAHDPSRSRSRLVDGTLVAVLGGAIALASATAFVALMGYEPETARLIVLLALALAPAAAAQVAESVAQAWERAQLILWINGPVALLRVGAVYVVLERGATVATVAWILFAAYALTAAASILVVAVLAPTGPSRPSAAASWRLVRDSAPFLGINLAASLRGNIGTILVSGFLGEVAVGLFNAANQLTVPVRLVCENLVTSFFPAMVRRYRSGTAAFGRLMDTLIAVVAGLTLPLILALFVLAEPILVLVYREPAFAGAATVLMITIWAPFMDTLKGLLGQALWAGRREGVVLRVSLVNLLVSVVAGFALIPPFGLLGAAASVLVVAVVNLAQHRAAARAAFGDGVSLVRGLWRPLAGGAVMGGTLILVLPHGLVPSLAVASAAYLATWGGLLVVTAGGWRQARIRYVRPWLDEGRSEDAA